MKKERSDIGYAFALPRLIARVAGRPVRRAEWCRWEAYGLGIFVFGISCLFMGRRLFPFVRGGLQQALFLLFLPFAVWVGFLLLYFLNAQVIAVVRRFGLYSAQTNNAFQHRVIMTLTSGLALLFLRDDSIWFNSLGMLWLGLLSCNLLAALILQLRHET